MKTILIGVITTCQKDFDRYFDSQSSSTQSILHKISFLRDIKHKEYAKAVLLVESKNVPDRVINEVKEMSLITEDLSQNTFYN